MSYNPKDTQNKPGQQQGDKTSQGGRTGTGAPGSGFGQGKTQTDKDLKQK